MIVMLLTAQTSHFAAIKATITGRIGCSNTYQITVHESFDEHTCSVINMPMGTATLHTSDGHCSTLMDMMNTPVLIAGTYTGTDADGYQLHLGCMKQTGLISDWIPKYDNLGEWSPNRTC